MTVRLLIGDCRQRLAELPAGSVHTCVTSPPYFGLRDYGHEGQIGLEETPDAFVAQMVEVFREVRRVLRDDGTLWLNLGDSYADKQRQMIPARVALAMQADGWWLRDEIIWHKPRTTPAPVVDRTVAAHEIIFLLAKSRRYYFDWAAIEEPALCAGETRQRAKVFRRIATVREAVGKTDNNADEDRVFTVRETRRKRSVWSVNAGAYTEGHFATYPPELIEPCILAGSPKGGVVLDPFGGAGTTGLVADRLQRDAILIEINPAYAEIARKRLEGDGGMFSNVEAA